MRYFEIAKPSAKHILADADPERIRSGRTGSRGDTETFDGQPTCTDVEFVKSQSAVTSAAFITPAFAIAQGSVCPRNRSQPTLSSRV